METRYYRCDYCRKEFLPTRRNIQKFCSNSCRSKSHHQKTKISKAISISNSEAKIEKTSIRKMSLAGVGDAAAGTMVVKLAEEFFTHEENKPATKKDLQNLANKIQRYHRVKNMQPNFSGQLPYFDMESKQVVYFGF
jgi:pyridoxal/pyridoxine/pyridoxamine kinase